MIACAEARERIARWLSGEIDPGSRRALEEHLGACADCAADTERTRRAIDLLAAEDVPDPGAAYWSSFGGRLRARIAAADRHRRLRGLVASIAAAAIVVAGLALVQTRRDAAPRMLPVAGGPETTGETPPVAGIAHGGPPSAGSAPPAPRVLTVREAETGLRVALERAVAEGQDPGAIETILDDIAPADSLEGTDRFGVLSPEDDRRLSNDLLDPRG